MKILVADRLALVRGALKTLLESHGHSVATVAASGVEAVALTERERPDLVLLDLEGSPFEMLDAVRAIVAECPHLPVVVLAGAGEDGLFLEAVACGARGFLTRDLDEGVFCTLLERTGQGEIVVSPTLAGRLLEVYANASLGGHRARRPLALTQRERDVLAHLTRGVTSNRELAEALDLSENTVRFHVRNLLEKCHVHSRAAVVAYAYAHDAVDKEGAGSAG